MVPALDALCAALGPGGRIPTHTELMRRFDASERAVREALNELQRGGRIVRRNGVGTFVAATNGDFSPTASGRTLIAVTRPDRSFFDRRMDLLFQHAADADLNLAASSRPLGFVIFSYSLAPLAEQLQRNGQRVVIVGTPPVDVSPTVPCVYHDHNQGGYLVTRYLIALGHRRIAYASAGTGDLPRQMRWQGHQRALREARRAGVAIEDKQLPAEETTAWASNPARAAAFFAAPNAPTALIAWNDHEGARLLTTPSRAGVRVPHQVSLAGYDALPEGALVFPRLTTVDHAIGEQLRAAVDLLTRATPPPPTHTVVFVPNLLPGESTAPPPPPLP